jgi:hypothetical protein
VVITPTRVVGGTVAFQTPPLRLISASYDQGTSTLTLTFNTFLRGTLNVSNSVNVIAEAAPNTPIAVSTMTVGQTGTTLIGNVALPGPGNYLVNIFQPSNVTDPYGIPLSPLGASAGFSI